MTLGLYLEVWILVTSEDPWRKMYTKRLDFVSKVSLTWEHFQNLTMYSRDRIRLSKKGKCLCGGSWGWDGSVISGKNPGLGFKSLGHVINHLLVWISPCVHWRESWHRPVVFKLNSEKHRVARRYLKNRHEVQGERITCRLQLPTGCSIREALLLYLTCRFCNI